MPRRHTHTNPQRFEPQIPCGRKRAYRSEAEINKAIERMQLIDSSLELKAYICPYCHKWHLSSVK